MEKNMKYLCITLSIFLSGCISNPDITASNRNICGDKPAHLGADSKPCRMTFYKLPF